MSLNSKQELVGNQLPKDDFYRKLYSSLSSLSSQIFGYVSELEPKTEIGINNNQPLGDNGEKPKITLPYTPDSYVDTGKNNLQDGDTENGIEGFKNLTKIQKIKFTYREIYDLYTITNGAKKVNFLEIMAISPNFSLSSEVFEKRLMLFIEHSDFMKRFFDFFGNRGILSNGGRVFYFFNDIRIKNSEFIELKEKLGIEKVVEFFSIAWLKDIEPFTLFENIRKYGAEEVFKSLKERGILPNVVSHFLDSIERTLSQIVSGSTLPKEESFYENNELPQQKLPTLGIWEKIREYIKPSDSFAKKSRFGDNNELSQRKERSIIKERLK